MFGTFVYIIISKQIKSLGFVEFNAFVPSWINIFANCLIKRFTNNSCSFVHCFSKFGSFYLPSFFSKTGTLNTNFITLSE